MVNIQEGCDLIVSEKPTRFFKTRKTEYGSNGDIGAFKSVSILPTMKDIREQNPFLRPNIVDGAYTDVREYLGTQFHLLREDYIAPFRRGIQMFRQVYLDGFDMNRGTLRRIEGVNFYLDAHFDHTKRRRLPESAVLLRLSWPDYNFVDWNRTDRLKSGCMLGISKDNFLTVELLVVSQAQTPNLLKRGILVVEFLSGIFRKPPSQDKWLIMENSTAYFEAYHHNLRVIKSMDPSKFPLQQYLAKAERSVKPPSFLRVNRSLDFEPILKKEETVPKSSIEWPEQEETILNEQQYKAVKSAFERELCIIQGPPGTGKTFVALRIVEMLLLNRVTDRPILVVCYTNHALDQFLEGMLLYTEEIVRVGGSSKSEMLKNYTLNELLKGSNSDKQLMNQLESDRDECEKRIDQLTGLDILSDKEFDLEVDGLEKFLELTAPVVPQHSCFGSSSEAPRRDSTFLKDQDRGQLERTKVSHVSQQLLEDELRKTQRAVIKRKLKGHEARRPSEHFIARTRESMSGGLKTGKPLRREHKWALYRDAHWRFMEEWARDYVTKCATLRESTGVYLSGRRAARNPVKNDFVGQAKSNLKARIAEINRDTARIRGKNQCSSKHERRIEIVKSCRVLGMTTTGAAKFNYLLEAVHPQIVVVEESAEVLEAHLLASLTPTTKQLILIGDHQQLQPSTAVHRLATEFRMEVSLFERLVRNGIDFVKLQEQHRMRDEFLSLLVPYIYENYYSHSDVNEYPDVKGIASNVFFMKHSHKELADPHAHSKSNTFEAEIVVRLAYHFLQQGYKETEITILATYRGQIAAIEQEVTKFCGVRGFTEMQDVETFHRNENGRREFVTARVPVNPNLPMSPFEGMRVTTVDNYQGEENKIIIVSLVRSNDEAKIGFLSRENRVCVALSRAKHGLYCVGDIPLLAKASPLWSRISEVMTEKRKIGDGLELVCASHCNQGIVRTAEEFDEWSKRGCGRICAGLMPCGHSCDKVCHTEDSMHEAEFKCDQKCARMLPCGHFCQKSCQDECAPCTVIMFKNLECGHTVKGRCCDDSKCPTIVVYDPPCGHIRVIPCNLLDSPDLVCGKPVRLYRPCGHYRQASCDGKFVDDPCAACEARRIRRAAR